MIYSVATFQIKPQKIKQAKACISEFVNRIQELEPGTMMYKSLQGINEDTEFIHIMAFKDKEAQQLHKKSSYCRSFTDKLYPLCEAKPLDSDYQLNESIEAGS
jgi:quinol monooxygenase YgiN